MKIHQLKKLGARLWARFKDKQLEKFWAQEFYKNVDLPPDMEVPKMKELANRAFMRTETYLHSQEICNWYGCDAELANAACTVVMLAKKMHIPLYPARCSPCFAWYDNQYEINVPKDDPWQHGLKVEIGFVCEIPSQKHLAWLADFATRIITAKGAKITVEYTTKSIILNSHKHHRLHREIYRGELYRTPAGILKMLRLFAYERIGEKDV